MTEQTIMQLGRDTLAVTAIVSAPLLLVAVVVGLGISILQTVTSVQEQTLTFAVKVAAVLVAAVFLMPWLLRTLCQFTAGLLSNLGHLGL